MATSGGALFPNDASAGSTIVGTNAQDVNAFTYINRASSSWTPVIAPGNLADGNSGVQIMSNALFAATSGTTFDRLRTPNVWKQIAALAIGAEATIWTPAAGKKFRLMGYVFATSAAVTVTLRDNTAGTIIRTLLTVANTPVVVPVEGNGTLSAAANNVLTATASGAANLTGYVYGTEE